MSGSLKRALGLWVASKVSGLHVYADDLANASYQYPSCIVTEVDHSVAPVGCGKKDFAVRDPRSAFVTGTGRMHREETAYRLTFSAPDSTQRAGQETVDSMLETVEQAVLAAQSDPGQVVLTDTAAVVPLPPPRVTPPAPTFPLEALRVSGRQQVPPDTTGEPFLFRAALTLRLLRMVPIERPVEHVMEHIHVEENGNG